MANDTDSNARLRRAASGTPRRAATRAALFLGLALVTALATALMLTRYMERRLDSARVETTKVVVAAVDLPIATTIRPEALTTLDWPKDSQPQGTTSDPSSLVGRVVTTRIQRDEPILASKLAARDAGSGLAAVLPPEMRAVAVRVDDVVAVAGFIHPGDNVDVIVTMKPTEQVDALPTSKVILQNVRVLAVGKQIERDEKSARKPVEATVATLMVNSEQAEKLALAATKGKILLALRSSLDEAIVETKGSVPPTLLAGPEAPARTTPETRAERSSNRAARSTKPAATVKPERDTEVVEILRGDKFEERRFKEKGEP